MNKFVVILLALSLAACGSTKEIAVPVYVSVQPNLPPISAPARIEFGAPQWDLPRDMTAQPQIKNLSTCINVAEEKQNNSFWRRCGEFPVDENSNLYMGFDLDNYNVIVLNVNKMKLQLKAYWDTIQKINAERELWREQNERARQDALDKKREIEE